MFFTSRATLIYHIGLISAIRRVAEEAGTRLLTRYLLIFTQYWYFQRSETAATTEKLAAGYMQRLTDSSVTIYGIGIQSCVNATTGLWTPVFPSARDNVP